MIAVITLVADNMVAHLGHTGAGDEADVAGSEDCYLH